MAHGFHSRFEGCRSKLVLFIFYFKNRIACFLLQFSNPNFSNQSENDFFYFRSTFLKESYSVHQCWQFYFVIFYRIVLHCSTTKVLHRAGSSVGIDFSRKEHAVNQVLSRSQCQYVCRLWTFSHIQWVMRRRTLIDVVESQLHLDDKTLGNCHPYHNS